MEQINSVLLEQGPPTPRSIVVFCLMCYIPIPFASNYGQWRRFLLIFSNDCRRKKKKPEMLSAISSCNLAITASQRESLALSENTCVVRS